MPTNFLDLPRELRDWVYHALWQHTPCLRGSSDTDYIVDVWHTVGTYKKGNRRVGATALPSWLLTCKQILQKGVAEFQFWGCWEITPGPNYVPEPSYMPTLLCLAEARHLYFDFDDLWEDWRHGESASAPAESTLFADGTAAFLRYVGIASKAKGVSISFTICESSNIDKQVDLFAIVAAALFSSNVIELAVVVSPCRSRQLRGSTIQACASEVKRLGMSMMGTVTEPVIREDGNETTITFHRLPSSTSAS